MDRISKANYYLDIAQTVLERATSLRHMEQEVASPSSSPVRASRPTRYSVPPTMSRREAEMMAFASAWTLRHSSYRSPRGTCMASREQ